MAASFLGRSLLLRSRICSKRILTVSQRPWKLRCTPLQFSSVTPLTVSRRWYSQVEPESGFHYAKTHEWVSLSDSMIATVGIADYAQEKLGDIVYVDLPDVGLKLAKEDVLGSVESVKAVGDVYAPVGGTVTEVNEELLSSPELINKDPHGKGWIVKLKDVDKKEFDDLMSVEEYKTFLKEEEAD